MAQASQGALGDKGSLQEPQVPTDGFHKLLRRLSLLQFGPNIATSTITTNCHLFHCLCFGCRVLSHFHDFRSHEVWSYMHFPKHGFLSIVQFCVAQHVQSIGRQCVIFVLLRIEAVSNGWCNVECLFFSN